MLNASLCGPLGECHEAREGERKPEDAAAIFARLDADLAAMRPHDLASDVEA